MMEVANAAGNQDLRRAKVLAQCYASWQIGGLAVRRTASKVCLANSHKSSRTTPSFEGLRPASARASRAARGASAKMNTPCEIALRRELWRRGLRYRLHQPGLPGRPDIVFPKLRLVIFCDGDFWHGRDLETRLTRLASGYNAPYWVAKLRTNVERDHAVKSRLEEAGWRVLRLWETDILREPARIADLIAALL